MSSIIEGYNYDIFISYRQKDNKGDRWVSEFVDALKTELESTFKEEISVYFDINPHDGLLETHDVNESLKEKLKCLVFIPIISRTYCDPKSFAWEHEFKAFVDLASKDQFGLKVKLPNGNVASRVLPVRIHDLDNEDIKFCESVLGGVLRGVEFIYREQGVNRSLTPKDDERKNLNGTIYRNQINKVTLALKEIILGLKTEPVVAVNENSLHRELSDEVYNEYNQIDKGKLTKLSKRKLLIGVSILAILLIAALLAYPKIFKQDTLDKLRSSGERISIAVMPFQNMTNDTIWNVWQDGIQDMLITSLSNSEELKVRQRESVTSIFQGKGLTNFTSITPSVASNISKKLNANVFIFGSIKQAGFIIRVNAQLIDTKTKEVFKSFQIEGLSDVKNLFQIIDSISAQIRNYIVISKLINENRDTKYSVSTTSPEAYKYYVLGDKARINSDYFSATTNLLEAIRVDSNFVLAYVELCGTYVDQGMYEQAKKWSLILHNRRDLMPSQYKTIIDLNYAVLFETPNEAIKLQKLMIDIDDQAPVWYSNLGYFYQQLNQYDKSIPELEKALGIFEKWDSKPTWVFNYTMLGTAYHETGQYKKERRLYKKAEQNFPNDPELLYNQTVLDLFEGKIETGNKYVEKYRSICKGQLWPEARIINGVANIFLDADILDKAEEFYRKALSLEPENPDRLNNLAYFLIDKDRNISEGIELVEMALELNPDNYSYLHTKGWGLYREGNYQEASEILQKSWDIRREKAVYNHAAFLHLEAAKKAVARQ